jgi:hypothetical protein
MDNSTIVEMSDANVTGAKRPSPDLTHVFPSRSFKDALITPISISANIPPVIIKLIEPAIPFNSLSFVEQKAFVDSIETIVKPVRRSSAAPGGDLFLFPSGAIQKQLLLDLVTISSFKIQVSLTNMEKFPKKVSSKTSPLMRAMILSLKCSVLKVSFTPTVCPPSAQTASHENPPASSS